MTSEVSQQTEPKRLTARQRRRHNIATFRDSQPSPLPGHKAIRFGTGSAEWNRYLASLPPTERKAAIRDARAISWLGGHIACGPSASENPRYPEGRR